MKTTPRPCLTKRLALSCALSVAALASHTSHAQSTWVGDLDQNWNDANNWSGDTLPAGVGGDAGSNVIVNTATGNYPTLNGESLFTPNDLIVGDGAGNGRLDHGAGSLNVVNWSFLGNAGSDGVYNLADTSNTGGAFTGFAQGSGNFSSLNDGNFYLGGAPWVAGGGTSTVNMNTTGAFEVGFIAVAEGSGRTGTFNLDSGTVNVVREIFLGADSGSGTLNVSGGEISADVVAIARGPNNAATSQGELNMTGGAFNSQRWFTLGFAGAAGNNAVVNNDGGTINVRTGGVEGTLELGVWDTTANQFNQNSGSINLQHNSSIVFGVLGHSGVSTFDHNGGAVTFYSDGGSTVGGTGGVVLGGQGSQVWEISSGTYTYNLNGGTLTTPGISKASANATGNFNFNGGTLAATGDNATFMEGLSAANIQIGGAVINSNGFNVTINQALLDGTGGGGLAKIGLGTLTLTGANTYTGGTHVDGGVLATSGTGTLGSGDVIIAGGAGLVLGNDASINGDVFLFFGLDSTIVLDFQGSTTLGGLTYTEASSSLTETGSYDAAALNAFFDVTSFSGDGSLIIPEPSTYALIFGGLALAGVLVRRRLRKS